MPRSALSFLFAGVVLAGAARGTDAAGLPVTVDRAQEEFTLIVVPDTQRYARYYPFIFRTQFQWIRDSIEALNVKYVIHVGDIVDDDTEEEWKVADESFALIDGLVPYLAVPGNHDLDHEVLDQGIRASTRYNALFSPKRYLGRPWYGGHKGVTGDNSFGYFSAAGWDFLVVGLEFGPTDETLAWANRVVDSHDETHHAIVVTHAYMYSDDTRLGEGDDYSPHKKSPAWNDGEQIWEKFVRKGTAIRLVLSGHVKHDGTGFLVSEGDEGNQVVQILANYQFLEHGGQGWLRILKFKPVEGKMEVYTYSPFLKAFRDDPDQRFDVDLPWLAQ